MIASLIVLIVLDRRGLVRSEQSAKAPRQIAGRARVMSPAGSFETYRPQWVMSALRGKPEDICPDRVLPTLTQKGPRDGSCACEIHDLCETSMVRCDSDLNRASRAR
jgi:hypothetical protein